jgi:aspartate/methionine/tyrosine aminotransferase
MLRARLTRAMPDTLPTPGHAGARDAVRSLEASQIRAVANAAMGDPGVLAFWFGEPDTVTPTFVRDAAAASLARGETFYTQNFGIPGLREALAGYVGELHVPIEPERVAVTASGMSALAIALQALVGAGDRVVAVTPLWPNLTEFPRVLGAHVERVPLRYGSGRFALDLEELLEALAPGTRALLVNSPNNPTGWTLTRDEQRVLLAHCRRHGIWIVADDVYERLCFRVADRAAPSFLSLAEPGDRLVSTNSFSKAWCMTGWRLGWLVGPPALLPEIGKLVEYNTSCSPAFVQQAGIAALVAGESFTRALRERLHAARDHLVAGLAAMPGIEVAAPAGAMYAFFRVDGVEDSVHFCTRLVREVQLGLAPGRAFGPEGEGFVRWCFASDHARLDAGLERLRRFMDAMR